MKKSLVVLFASVMFISLAEAQVVPKTENAEVSVDEKKKKPKAKRQDFILLNFNWNTWFNSPEGMTVSPFSRGFEAYLMYDFTLGRSPISIGTGIGFSSENIFSNAFLRDSNGGNNIYFEKIEPIINSDFQDPKRDWNRYKLATTIIELPLELRFKLQPSRRNTFKMAAGFKIGYVIDTWEKYRGPDYRMGNNTDVLNTEVKIKEYTLPGVTRFRYGVYGRIGYSRYFATFSYNFSNFFESGKGVDGVTPFSVGICVSLF